MKKNWQIKLGIFLMVFSGVFFAATLLIPLTNLPAKTKIIGSTVSILVWWVIGRKRIICKV